MSHSDVKDQADPSEKEGKAAENGALAPLRIVRAAENNLRDVTVSLPKYKLVVVTGLSGSGKSSLIFDCLVKEAQRQLISTFTSFARQRLPKFDRPKVGAIHNMSTAIVVDQKRIGMSSRATVGTATECFSLLRLIFARLGCCSSIGVDSETGSEANGRARLLLSSASFSFNKPEGMCPGCQGIGQRLQPDITKLVDPALTLATGAVRHPDYRVGGWLWKTLVVTALFDMHLPLSEWSQDDLCVLLFAPKRPVPVDCDRRALLKELTTAARAEMAKSPTARDDLRRVLAPLAQQGGDDEAGPAAGNSTRSSSNSGKSSGAARGGKGARGTRKARKAPSPAGGGDTKPPSRPARAAKRGRAAPKQATAEGPRPRKRAARQAPTRTRSGARSARDASGSSDGSDSSSSSSSGGGSDEAPGVPSAEAMCQAKQAEARRATAEPGGTPTQPKAVETDSFDGELAGQESKDRRDWCLFTGDVDGLMLKLHNYQYRCALSHTHAHTRAHSLSLSLSRAHSLSLITHGLRQAHISLSTPHFTSRLAPCLTLALSPPL